MTRAAGINAPIKETCVGGAVQTADDVLLRTIATTRAVRYFYITLWGLVLLTVAPMSVVLIWYVLTLAAGMTRSFFDGDGAAPETVNNETASNETANTGAPLLLRWRQKLRSTLRYAFIAMFSTSFWAAAPVIAWSSGASAGPMVAVILLMGGYMLALAQFRTSIIDALVATAPYSAVFAFFLISSIGQPSMMTMMAMAAILVTSAGYGVIFGKLTENEIRRVNDERQRLIQDLENARISAEKASAAKSMFLANMSHEIRTPMNGVLGMTELLMRTELDQRQQMFAETIQKSGGALLSIINDILDFSKIEAGRLELDPAPFDLRAAIEDVAALMAPRGHEKGVEIIARFQPGLSPWVNGDAGRIRQIITNLAANAVKFTEQGYILISVSGQTVAGETALKIEVRDTGIGIEPDHLTKIFRSFQQADVSTTRRFGGTGLGLSISKRLAEAMSGEIYVESTLHEGSCFWIELTLPAADADQETTADLEWSTPPRILVVDDIDVNRQISSELLESWGFETNVVPSGAAALSVLRQATREGRGFHLAIVDYLMPEMDGEMLVRAIKADPAIASTPILVLTSVDQQGDIRRFRALGVDGYLVKPARASLLLREVKDILLSTEKMKPEPKGSKQMGATTVNPEMGNPDTAIPEGGRTPKNPNGDQDGDQNGDHDHRQRRRILLAEDNDVNQLVVRHMLPRDRYDIEIAGNGAIALNTFENAENPFDIILMDVSMPEMDGHEAAAAIRAVEVARGLPRTPIICLTAHVLETDVQASRHAGMDDFLAKPINQHRLREILDQWIPSESTGDGARDAG